MNERATMTRTPAARVTRMALGDVPWSALSPGVQMRVVHADPASGRWSALIHMLPASRLIPHRHIGASEFFVFEGSGTHPQAGSFQPGDYAWEPAGAVHTEVLAEQDLRLFMVSHGSSEFLRPNGSVWYVADAAYFHSLMRTKKWLRGLKRFVLIDLWRALRRRPRRTPSSTSADMDKDIRILNPLERPRILIENGTQMRVLHIDDDIGVVSLLIEVPAGGALAERELVGTSETLVLDGTAHHPELGPLATDDYLREEGPGRASRLTTEEGATFLIFDRSDTQFTDGAGREASLADLLVSNGALARQEEDQIGTTPLSRHSP